MNTTTTVLVENTKLATSGSGDRTHVTMQDKNATPSSAANQDEPLTGQDLVAVVTTIVDRSVVKLSTMKQSLHLLHHNVDDADLMQALQDANIIEIDCKVHCIVMTMILIF